MVKVLFVCMGNICRSPTAHGVFARMVEEHGLANEIEVDSAGTHAYHIGEPPDRRAQAAALKRGTDMKSLRARRVEKEDFERFDYVLPMDDDNYDFLEDMCPPQQLHKLLLFMSFAPQLRQREVPDPYYGGLGGFEQVLDMVEAAAAGLLEDIRQRYLMEA